MFLCRTLRTVRVTHSVKSVSSRQLIPHSSLFSQRVYQFSEHKSGNTRVSRENAKKSSGDGMIEWLHSEKLITARGHRGSSEIAQDYSQLSNTEKRVYDIVTELCDSGLIDSLDLIEMMQTRRLSEQKESKNLWKDSLSTVSNERPTSSQINVEDGRRKLEVLHKYGDEIIEKELLSRPIRIFLPKFPENTIELEDDSPSRQTGWAHIPEQLTFSDDTREQYAQEYVAEKVAEQIVKVLPPKNSQSSSTVAQTSANDVTQQTDIDPSRMASGVVPDLTGRARKRKSEDTEKSDDNNTTQADQSEALPSSNIVSAIPGSVSELAANKKKDHSESDESVVKGKADSESSSTMSSAISAENEKVDSSRMQVDDTIAKFRPVTTVEKSSFLVLDDRDLKHLVLSLVAAEFERRPVDADLRGALANMHPIVKILCEAYGIRSVDDYRRIVSRMAEKFDFEVRRMMQQERPKQLPPAHVLASLDHRMPEEISGMFGGEFNEFGHKLGSEEARDLTSNELDLTVRRMMNLDSALGEMAVDKKQEDSSQSVDESTNDDQSLDAFEEAMDAIQQRWNPSKLAIEEKNVSRTDPNFYIGGDWRVRLGLVDKNTAEREARLMSEGVSYDASSFIENSRKNQENEDWTSMNARRRYRVSPYKLKGLPFDESKDLQISWKNVKLLNEYINSRGMILPRYMTGLNLKAQKQIARSIKIARELGLLPYTCKLLINDTVQMRLERELFEMQMDRKKKAILEDTMLSRDELYQLYPEFVNPSGFGWNEEKLREAVLKDEDERYKEVYNISDDELIQQRQVQSEHERFLKSVKSDIMGQLPDYWHKRLQFRAKSLPRWKHIEKKSERALRPTVIRKEKSL